MDAGRSEAILSFAHTLLYGIYLATLGYCLRWLVFDTEGWQLRRKIHWPTVTVTLLLFVLSTSNVALVLWMALLAIEGQPASSYANGYVWAAAVGVAILLVVDAVLIFRCWLVYLKRWYIVIIPLVFWLADLILAIIGLVMIAPNSPWPKSGVNSSSLYRDIFIFDIVFFVCEIGINVYVTTAIVIQILRVTRYSDQPSGPLREIGRILAESGILFTVTCIFNLFFRALAMGIPKFQLTSLIMSSINNNTATIAFNLVLIRMAQEQPHTVIDSEGSSKEPMLTTLPFGTSTCSATPDGSIVPDIEMQAISRKENSSLRSS